MAVETTRAILTHADMANADFDDLRGILRAWCDVRQIRPPRFCLSDADSARERVLSEKVTVSWARVRDWAAHGLPGSSDAPPMTNALEWAVDRAVLGIIKSQRMVIPGGEDHPDLHIQPPDEHVDQLHSEQHAPMESSSDIQDAPDAAEANNVIPSGLARVAGPQDSVIIPDPRHHDDGVPPVAFEGVRLRDDQMELDAPPSNQAALFQNRPREAEVEVDEEQGPDAGHPIDALTGRPADKSVRVATLDRALEACGFPDPDYDVNMHVDSDDISMGSASDFVTSSRAHTPEDDVHDDLKIRPNEKYPEYEALLVEAQNNSAKVTVLFAEGDHEKWPSDTLLHGCGKIAMFGRYYRTPGVADHLFFLMRDVPLRYCPGARAVFALTEVIAYAIAESLQGLEGNLYLSVPIMAEGVEHRRRFAAIDQHGEVHLTNDIEKIPLRVLDGCAEDPALSHVFFAVDYILENIPNLMPCSKPVKALHPHEGQLPSLQAASNPVPSSKSSQAAGPRDRRIQPIQAPQVVPSSKPLKAKAVGASTRKKVEQPVDSDSDIEILDGPPPPSKQIKQELTPLQEAILKWLREYRDGYYHTHPVVLQIRGLADDSEDSEVPSNAKDTANVKGGTKAKMTAKDKADDKGKAKSKGKAKANGKEKEKDRCRVPQAFTRLQSWIQIVTEINSIPETDDSAELFARHKSISQILIGRFLNWSHDWVQNCCRVQALLSQHGKHPAIQSLTAKLENEALGVNKLLTALRAAIDAQPADDISIEGEDYNEPGKRRPSYVEVGEVEEVVSSSSEYESDE